MDYERWAMYLPCHGTWGPLAEARSPPTIFCGTWPVDRGLLPSTVTRIYNTIANCIEKHLKIEMSFHDDGLKVDSRL
jgi:hypothetical protein